LLFYIIWQFIIFEKHRLLDGYHKLLKALVKIASTISLNHSASQTASHSRLLQQLLRTPFGMGFASAAVSAVQNPCQPYGTGHLFLLAHSGLYPPKLQRLTRLYVAGVAEQVAGVVFPRTGRAFGGQVWPPKRPAP
jgi:hypothetical protein